MSAEISDICGKWIGLLESGKNMLGKPMVCMYVYMG